MRGGGGYSSFIRSVNYFTACVVTISENTSVCMYVCVHVEEGEGVTY